MVVGNLAFHPHVAEGAFEDFADPLGELADLPDVALGHEIEEIGLAHGISVWRSSAEVVDDPEQDREREADDEARDDRKVKRRIAALIGDVAGQPPETKRKLCANDEQHARAHQDNAENQENFTEFTQRVHMSPSYFKVFSKALSDAPGQERTHLQIITKMKKHLAIKAEDCYKNRKGRRIL